MELLITFIILNIANVIIQTVKSIATIKCGKTLAALVNAVAYGLYTVVIVYTNANLNLWIKVAVVALANLVGVWVVKFIEEKTNKEKLWKVTVTVPHNKVDTAVELLENIPLSVIFATNGCGIFECYCNTKKDTNKVIQMSKMVGGKCFATENKLY